MDKRIVTIYQRYYDDKTKEPENCLGTFEVLQQIVEDAFQDTFIGKNAETNEITLIMAHEIKGVGGGIGYEVTPLNIPNIDNSNTKSKRKIVTLSGSMKYWHDFVNIGTIMECQGYIVLTPFPVVKDSIEISEEEMKFYEELHMDRIAMSDKLFVINKDGYIGDSTRKEIEYARANNVDIEYLEPVSSMPIITLIGSAKFYNTFKNVAVELSIKDGGAIINMPAIFDDPDFVNNGGVNISKREHEIYDRIHEQKMSMSNFVVVIDVDGYIGENTKQEIEYCKLRNIPVMSYREINYLNLTDENAALIGKEDIKKWNQ